MQVLRLPRRAGRTERGASGQRKDLAQGAPVSALDSIETGAWAKANLTDGALVTLQPGSASDALPATMVRNPFAWEKQSSARPSMRAPADFMNCASTANEWATSCSPEWTSYRKRIQYQTFDVTERLRPGENVLAASLGEGWYSGRLMAVGRNAYGSDPRFLLQLEIELADGPAPQSIASRQAGRTQRVVTDASWRSTTARPVRSSGIYDGEAYDARKEHAGWDAPGFSDSHWNQVKAFELGEAQLVWPRNEPIRVVRELPPIALTEPKPGVYVFDLGQNMVGWCRIHARGSAGQPITIRHAEMLKDDGTLYTANLRGARQTDRYIPRADGEVSFNRTSPTTASGMWS